MSSPCTRETIGTWKPIVTADPNCFTLLSDRKRDVLIIRINWPKCDFVSPSRFHGYVKSKNQIRTHIHMYILKVSLYDLNKYLKCRFLFSNKHLFTFCLIVAYGRIANEIVSEVSLKGIESLIFLIKGSLVTTHGSSDELSHYGNKRVYSYVLGLRTPLLSSLSRFPVILYNWVYTFIIANHYLQLLNLWQDKRLYSRFKRKINDLTIFKSRFHWDDVEQMFVAVSCFLKKSTHVTLVWAKCF